MVTVLKAILYELQTRGQDTCNYINSNEKSSKSMLPYVLVSVSPARRLCITRTRSIGSRILCCNLVLEGEVALEVL